MCTAVAEFHLLSAAARIPGPKSGKRPGPQDSEKEKRTATRFGVSLDVVGVLVDGLVGHGEPLGEQLGVEVDQGVDLERVLVASLAAGL